MGFDPDRAEVSLFVPTWNAGREFPEILRLMLSQELDRPFEVIVIDSGSSDGTVEFLKTQPVKLDRIPNREFDHGLTRNRGIELARGSIVVLATQDARPANDEWMQRLVDCFDDPEVAGAFGRQFPRDDANTMTRYRLMHWVAGTDEPVAQQVSSPEEFDALEPLERLRVAAFDNVSSAVRKSVMRLHPFQARKFGEDIDWSKRVILAGYKLVFEPRSRVIHSHNYSAWRTLKRIYGDHSNLHDLLGVHTIKTEEELKKFTAEQTARYLAFIEEDTKLTPFQKLLWRRRVRAHAWAENLGQFLGGCAARRIAEGSLKYRVLDRVLRRGV
jgi:rhamnosyltransferase